jgi:hypothetical protein
LIRYLAGTRTICSTTAEGVILRHSVAVEGGHDELLMLPGSDLADLEGSTDEGVKLDRRSKYRGELHWHSGTKPHKLPVELLMPGRQDEVPTLPPLTTVSAKLLSSLHECGRSAARDNGRLALSRIQVQGKAGRVIGTDGKVALLCRGFKFEFPDSILVPALPVFGSKPLGRVTEVKIGKTASHLVVVAEPWSVWLPLASECRYPDVADVIPKRPPTTVMFDEHEVVELLKVLPTLPGNDEDCRPVTVDANTSVTIRARGSATPQPKELSLTRSSATGEPACAAVDRRWLARGLSLGCLALKLTPDKPVVLEGNDFTFVAAPLDSALIVEAEIGTEKSTREMVPTTTIGPIEPERNKPMDPAKMNGHTPARGDPEDPLFAAEELRDALAVATKKAERLVSALKVGKKEKRVLASVFAGLKQLGLDSGGSR